MIRKFEVRIPMDFAMFGFTQIRYADKDLSLKAMKNVIIN